MITRTHIIVTAGVCLLGLMLALAAYNVGAFLLVGAPLLALVAIASESIGFVMAIVTEIAWKDRAERGKAPAIVCAGILVACAAFNIFGGEHAWARDAEAKATRATAAAQHLLDEKRSKATEALNTAKAEVKRFDPLLPDPKSNVYRQRDAFVIWTKASAQAVADQEKAQKALDALPLQAVQVRPVETSLAVKVGFGVAEVIKVLGLWACGFGAVALGLETLNGRRETLETAEAQGGTGGNALPMTPETLRETVRADRFQRGLSYGQIRRLRGVHKGTAWKWCNQPETSHA